MWYSMSTFTFSTRRFWSESMRSFFSFSLVDPPRCPNNKQSQDTLATSQMPPRIPHSHIAPSYLLIVLLLQLCLDFERFLAIFQ